MSELSTTFNQLHLAGTTDGNFRRDKLIGLSRLSPFVYIGGSMPEMATVGGYYDCPTLVQFRVAVREGIITPDPATPTEPSPEDDCLKNCVGHHPVRPNMFDLDTRNLYFGSLNQSPKLTFYPPLQAGYCEPIGRAVKGLPMRLQQVHFRAFRPQGESDEYSAYFLASNPVGPFEAKGSTVTVPTLSIDSDFNLQKLGTHLFWTHNQWTITGDEDTAIADFEKRLIIGDPVGAEGKRLKWKAMFDEGEGAPYEELAKKKRNVYNIILDQEGLIVRQTKPLDASGATVENDVPGWKYKLPLDVIIANRYRFNLPKGKGVPDGEEKSLQTGADHLVMEYYDVRDEFQEDKILRRPEPKKGHVIGCRNGSKWEAVPALTAKVLCELLPRIVTRVFSTGQGLFEDYVDITCYPSYDDSGNRDGEEMIVTPGIREIISFTDCKSEGLSSAGSGESGTSDGSSSSSSSSTSYSSKSSSSSSSSSNSSCTSQSSGEVDCGKCPGEESDTSGASS